MTIGHSVNDANRHQQQQLYGEPIAAIVGRVGQRLGMNQAQTARAIGLSAPMLSHLVTARRVKIGNPHALARLRALNDLALDVERGEVPVTEVDQRVERVVASDWSDRTTQQLRTDRAADPRDCVARVQALFRSVAGAEEWLRVVTALRAEHPAIAELLHAYGLARSDDALAHWNRVVGAPRGERGIQ